MLRLIRFLITGSWHEHEWVVIREGELTSHCGARGTRYILQCKTCGDIKNKDILY